MGKDFDIEKLKGSENYHTWQFALRSYLEYLELDHTLEKEPETVSEGSSQGNSDSASVASIASAASETAKAKAEFKKKSNKAKAILRLFIDQSLYVHVEKCTSALEVWDNLKKLFDDKGTSRKTALLKKLITIKLDESESMQDYIDKVASTANKLTGIGFAITDEWLGAILLAGLTDDYRPFIMGIEANDAKITGDVIISKLMDWQPANSSGAAFFAKKNNKTNFKQKGKGKKRKCYNCGSLTHLANACDQKKKDDKKSLKPETAFMVGLLSVADKNEWYVDSGASSHMSPHSDILSEQKTADTDGIKAANNSRMEVKSTGNCNLNIGEKYVQVTDVLHVPNLSANLLSVYKIVCQGNTVVFDANGCHIYNSDGKEMATCKPENGTYKIRAKPRLGNCMVAKSNESNSLLWHRRCGHVSLQKLKKMRDEAVLGISFNDNGDDIHRCMVCAMGKQYRQPFPSSTFRANQVLEKVHSDLCGPMRTRSIGGAFYILTFIDDYSRKTFVYFLKEKSQVLDAFMIFKTLMENQTEKRIKILRTDGGGEYTSKDFEHVCEKNGIKREMSNADTPQQNGVAERANRSILEKARCMIFDAKLGNSFWAEACSMAVHIMNRTPRMLLNNKTPELLWSGRKPDVSDLRVFGTPVMVHIAKKKRGKLEPKSEKMIFLGFDNVKKGYRCYDQNTKKVIVTRDAIFYETTSRKVLIDFDEDTDDEITSQEKTRDEIENENEITLVQSSDEEDQQGAVGGVKEPSSNDQPMPDNLPNRRMTESPPYIDDPKDKDFSTRARTEVPTELRQSVRNKKPVRPFQVTHIALLAIEPQSLEEAKKTKEASRWETAIKEEYFSHQKNNTWSLVNAPNAKNIVKSKWVFKLKTNDDGEVVRYKARLVAKGYSQQYGVDYDETFSPVVRNNTIRFLMALSVKRDLKLYQMDAETAFLQGDLTETVYMYQPEGFEDGTGRVCKLNKAIYGLKQAGRQWNLKLNSELINFGFRRSDMDPCVYIHKEFNLMLAVYVDDFIIFYRQLEELELMKRYLNSKFHMKELGELKNCLGMNFTINNGSIELDQRRYIATILDRFGMLDSKPTPTPSDPGQHLSVEMVTDENSLVGKIPYREAVGSLMYLANATRPDIAFAVNDLSRFNIQHAEPHWRAVKRVFRYLKGTIHYALKFTNENSDTDIELVMYTDADWASEIDSRRSCSGYVGIMAGAAISWQSKRQPIVALSSTEAEYIALSEAVKEVIWLKQLITEIVGQYDKPIRVICDNSSAINLAEREGYRPRSKHIDVRYHHLRENVKDGVIEIVHIGTNEMIADSLTKPVFGGKTEFCSQKMGLFELHN